MLALTLLFGALSTAVAVLALSAAQLSSPRTAQPLLERAVASLFEIDTYVRTSWPAFEAAAKERATIPLVDLPLPLELRASALSEGPDVVADGIAAAAAELIFHDGVEVIADSNGNGVVVSTSGVFDAAIGRLTEDARGIAVVLLVISGALALLFAAAAAAQASGLWRVGAAALSLGLGAGIAWIGSTVARAIIIDQASSTPDPFEADLWLIAADALSLLVRNAGVAGIACAVVLGAAAAGGLLLRISANDESIGPAGL